MYIGEKRSYRNIPLPSSSNVMVLEVKIRSNGALSGKFREVFCYFDQLAGGIFQPNLKD